MQQAAIVPQHQIARPPAVAVDAAEADDALVEIVDQPPPLVIAHADDAFGVVAEIGVGQARRLLQAGEIFFFFKQKTAYEI